jgi:hypothetical protein
MVNPTLNGQTKWLIWSAGSILTILVFGMGILSNGVIENERQRIRDATEIRTIHHKDAERISRLEECVLYMKSDLSSIKMDVKEIMRVVVK